MPSLGDVLREGMMVRIACRGCPRVVFHHPRALMHLYGGDKMLEQISVRCLRCQCRSWGATAAEPMQGPAGKRYPMPIAIQEEVQPDPPTASGHGAYLLCDVRTRWVEVQCVACNRHGKLSREKLIAKYGPKANMPGLLHKIAADCPKVVAKQFSDPCRIHYLSPIAGKARHDFRESR